MNQNESEAPIANTKTIEIVNFMEKCLTKENFNPNQKIGLFKNHQMLVHSVEETNQSKEHKIWLNCQTNCVFQLNQTVCI